MLGMRLWWGQVGVGAVERLADRSFLLPHTLHFDFLSATPRGTKLTRVGSLEDQVQVNIDHIPTPSLASVRDGGSKLKGTPDPTVLQFWIPCLKLTLQEPTWPRWVGTHKTFGSTVCRKQIRYAWQVAFAAPVLAEFTCQRHRNLKSTLGIAGGLSVFRCDFQGMFEHFKCSSCWGEIYNSKPYLSWRLRVRGKENRKLGN